MFRPRFECLFSMTLLPGPHLPGVHLLLLRPRWYRAYRPEVGPGRYFSPRHRMLFSSRDEHSDALDDVAGNGPGRCCSPRRRMPLRQETMVPHVLDDVAGNVCWALILGGAPCSCRWWARAG